MLAGRSSIYIYIFVKYTWWYLGLNPSPNRWGLCKSRVFAKANTDHKCINWNSAISSKSFYCFLIIARSREVCWFLQKITNLMPTFKSIGMKSKNKTEEKKLNNSYPSKEKPQPKFHFWLQWTWSTTSIPLNHDNYLVFEIVVSHLGGFCIDVLINNKVFPGS